MFISYGALLRRYFTGPLHSTPSLRAAGSGATGVPMRVTRGLQVGLTEMLGGVRIGLAEVLGVVAGGAGGRDAAGGCKGPNTRG